MRTGQQSSESVQNWEPSSSRAPAVHQHDRICPKKRSLHCKLLMRRFKSGSCSSGGLKSVSFSLLHDFQPSFFSCRLFYVRSLNWTSAGYLRHSEECCGRRLYSLEIGSLAFKDASRRLQSRICYHTDPDARAKKHKKCYNAAAKAARKEKYDREKHLISQV